MIEQTVSRILYVAHLLERAIHEPSGWSIQWGPHTVQADREVSDHGVTFRAEFAETCYLSPTPRNASLCFRGDVVAVRAMDHPGDSGFVLTWDLAASPVGAAA